MAKRSPQQLNILLGCGLLLLVGLISAVGGSVIWLQQDLNAMQYPGSQGLKGRTHYSLQPNYLRMEHAYTVQERRIEVEKWYVLAHDMRSGERNDECVSLSKTKKSLLLQRQNNVTICEYAGIQTIWITRITSRR